MRIASTVVRLALCALPALSAQSTKKAPTHWVLHLNGQDQLDLEGFDGNVSSTSGPFSVKVKGQSLMGKAFGGWIADAVRGVPTKVDGSLFQADNQGNVVNALDVSQAVPTHIVFSALDAKSTDRTSLTFSVSAAKQTLHAASGSVTGSNPAMDQLGPMAGKFSVTFEGENLAGSTGVDAMTVPDHGGCGPITVTVPADRAKGIQSWAKESLVQTGNDAKGNAHAHSGTIAVLGMSSTRPVLYQLEVTDAFPTKLSDASGGAMKLELACKALKLTFPDEIACGVWWRVANVTAPPHRNQLP